MTVWAVGFGIDGKPGSFIPVTSVDPLPVAGTFVGTNPSVGANAAAIPGFSTLIGWEDGTGKLQPISATNPLPISGTISATSSIHATSADPTYVNGTDNPFSCDLAGYARSLCKQTGTWTVGISASQTIGVTNFPTTVDTNSGNTGASTLRSVIATNNPAIANWGHGATAAAVPANATQSGARAATANPTAVTDGQLVAAMADKEGRQVVVTNAPRALKAPFSVNATDNSSHTLIAAGAAGVFNDIVGLIITNTSSTNTSVTISDGTTSYVFSAPANDTRGISIPDGLIAAASATAWTFQAATGVSTLYLSGTFVKNL